MNDGSNPVIDIALFSGAVSWLVGWAKRLRKLSPLHVFLVTMVSALVLVLIWRYAHELGQVLMSAMTVAQTSAGIYATNRRKEQ